jgi:hypothetical protein
VNHRHLLPNEIDLLLDGEVGFGVAPLRGHVATCDQCSAELDSARAVVEALDHLPRFAPSPLFADRVLAEVRVFEPWHVSALDAARRYVPSSAPARVLVAAGASSVGLLLTVLTVWLTSRLDAFLFVSQLLFQRGRDAFLAGASAALGSLLGEPALTAIRASGTAGIAIAATAAVVAGLLAARTLRYAIASARRNG